MKTGSSIFREVAPWVGFLLWAMVLWKLSSLSGRDLHGPDFPFADKLAHIVYFFAGGIMLSRPIYETFHFNGWRLVITVVILIAAIGTFDELHQLSTPGRTGASGGDWLADCIGGFLGAFVMAWSYGGFRSK